MRKHKRRIGLLTLTVFLLMTFISGFGTALASEKTPVSKGPVAKPALSGSSGGAAQLGEQELLSNVEGNVGPHLDDLKVIWGPGYADLISSNNYGQCFATTHSTTVPANTNTVNVTFDPHKNEWSEWWLGSAEPPADQRNRQTGSSERTIPNVALQDGDNIITIRLKGSGQFGGQILTVTLTITKPCVDQPHLDSLKVDGQELITDSSKKIAPSHSITVSENLDEADVVFLPHNADWSEWWLGSAEPPAYQRHRQNGSSQRTIPDVALQDGDNIVTIRVGDYSWLWGDREVLTVTLTITKPASTVPVTGVSLNKDTLDLVVGGIGSLAATIAPPNATNQNVTWSASSGVVTLTPSGLNCTVEAGSTAGTATVTVTTEDGNKTDTCTVTVWDLSLDKTSLEMTAGGGARTLNATPSHAGKTVSWSSSNSAVASVNSTGVVTPGVKGTASITASINVDGTILSRTCDVDVRYPLDVFVVGEPTLNPDGTYTATFGYTSDYTTDTDSGLLSQNLLNGASSGILPTVFSPGTNNSAFTINYMHSEGEQTWTVTYDGVTDIAAAGIEGNPQVGLDKSVLDLVVNGASGYITATISRPMKTMTKGVTSDIAWSIESGGEYVSIEGLGRTCTVTPITDAGAGTAIIKATFAGGNSAFCTVKVWDLYLDKTSLEMTAGGGARTLNATPSHAGKTVSWSSSNSAVASVNSTGVVTPGVKGTASITASINVDGTILSRTCDVDVRYPLDVFVVGEPTLNPDGTYTATFGYTSDYTTDTDSGLLSRNLLNGASSGILPTVFIPGTNNSAFTINYMHSEGEQTWTVTYDGVTDITAAGIEGNPQVGLIPSTLDLVVNGSSKNITATISRPMKTMTKGVTSDIAWSIESGGEYVSIEGLGQTCTVTPITDAGAGTAIIKATFAGGNSAFCTVTVWDLSLTAPYGFFLTAGGKSKYLTAVPSPKYKKVSWGEKNPSDKQVIKVNKKTGKITPLAPGEAKVTARIDIDDTTWIEKEYDVKVYAPIDVSVSEPVLNTDGTYTATFYYTNNYDWDVDEFGWGDINKLTNGGHVKPPKTFKTGGPHEAFTVTYLHSGENSPSWTVKYDGVKKKATAGKLQDDEIEINVIPEELELVAWGESYTLTANVEQVDMIALCFGPTSDIVWSVKQEEGENVIRDYSHRGQSFTVYPHDPGTALVIAEFANGDVAECEVTVIDPRTISLNDGLTLKARRDPGTLVAAIYNAPEVGEDSGYDWGITWSTEQGSLIKLEPGDDGTCSIVPLKSGYATVTATLKNGASDSTIVRVRSVNQKQEEEPETKSAPAALPEIPAPPALETLDVTITIGNTVAIVNGEQVTLAGNPLLIGADRAMVDYADMAKLIPGLQVAWDWKTLSVTFTKDGKELKMVLDQVPADFDVPFMNIGGRLLVPVRYVGGFFGATVDWIGDTLVVHMYK